MDEAANTSHLWQTIAHYQAALARARQSNDARASSLPLYMLAQSYQQLELWPEAIDHFTQLLAVFQECGDRRGESRAQISLGYLCIQTDRSATALPHFEAALRIARDLGERDVEAESLAGLGNALRDVGKPDEALARFQGAVALFDQLGNSAMLCQALGDLGATYAYVGRMQEATSHLGQALALALRLSDPQQQAHLLVQMASVQMADRQTHKERECLTGALALFRLLRDPWGEARTLANLSDATTRDRPTPQAVREGLRLLEEAMSLAARLDDRELSGYIQMVRGRVCERAGLGVEALASYQKSLSLGGRHRQVERLRNVGRMFGALGKPEDALKYDRDALLQALALDDRGAEIEQLIHIADDYLQAGSPEESCRHLERATRLALAGDDAVFTGRLQLRLAHLLSYCQEKQPARSLALWRVGVLYMQVAGSALRLPGELDTLLLPVRALLAVLGKDSFLKLWDLSEPLYQQLLAQGESTPTFPLVMDVVRRGDPFSFLDVEPLIAFLSRLDTRQLHDWILQAAQAPAGHWLGEHWAGALGAFFRGIAAEERSDWEAALAAFEQACTLAPTFAEAYIHRGSLLADGMDEEDQALADLDRAIELAPDYWQAYHARGHARSLSFEYERALADYTRALDLNPLAGACRYERAVASLAVGDAEGAMLDSARLTSEHHYHAAGWLVLGRAWLAMGEYDQAVMTFTDMIELTGFAERGDIYYYRALALLWLGNERKAKADLTRSWRDWEEVKAKIMLIWLAWGEKKPSSRTLSAWDEIATTYFPDWHADLLSLLLKLVRGPDEEVLDEFDQLIGVEPVQFEAPFWQGMACAVLGKGDEAVQLWDLALQLGMPPRLLAPLRWLEQDCPACWGRASALLDRFQGQLASGSAQS